MKIGFLGVGNMASAIIEGISSEIGMNNILLYDCQPEKAQRFTSQGATLLENANMLFEKSDYLFIAVKPQQFDEAVSKREYKASCPVIISIMAGVTTERIADTLGNDAHIIRIMPNAAITEKKGAAAITRGNKVTDEEFGFVFSLFKTVAAVFEVDESLFSVVTALSGSGPAYYYLFTKFIIEYAVSAGLDADTAAGLAVATAEGSASVMKKHSQELDELIRIVKSPKGTTEQALLSFEKNDLRKTVFDALTACEKRSDELSK